MSQGVMADTPTRSEYLASSMVARAASPSRRLSSAAQINTCVFKQDHRKADQSEGEVAGSKGSSYFTTVPRINPINPECVSSDAGTGDNTATGRPRFVIVTAPPSRFISLDNAQTPRLELRRRDLPCRHPILPSRRPVATKCTGQIYTTRETTNSA